MFSLARFIHHADRTMREGKWEKKKYYGIELSGKTVGVIGFGRIGKELSMKCKALGMNILAYDPYLNIEDMREYEVKEATLEELLSKSDFVSIHIPATPETKNFMDAKKLSFMKKTAYLINTSRGTVVDEQALITALQEGKIKGAGLDVYQVEPLDLNSPLLKLENVVLTPHIGAGTEDAQIVAGKIVVEEIQKVFGKT
jgi:D-3-phosphoglycerate dehydrogenase